MPGPTNAVVGELDEPTKLPETSVPDDVLAEEQKLAKYSKTAEFKRLKDFMEARVKFYQHFLPSGQRVEGDPKNGNEMLSVNVPTGDITAHWMAACIVIKEFENVLREYDQAAETIAEHARRKNT